MLHRVSLDPREHDELGAQVEFLDGGAAQVDGNTSGRQPSFGDERHADVGRSATNVSDLVTSAVLNDRAVENEVRGPRNRPVGLGFYWIGVEHHVTCLVRTGALLSRGRFSGRHGE